MEIIQNIWMALTTENANLTQIMVSPLAILEITLTMLLFTQIFNITTNIHRKIAYILSFSGISVTSNLFVPAPFNTYISVIACIILIMLIFKLNLFKAILAELVPYLIFVLVGIIVHNVYILATNVTTEMIMYIPIHKIITSFFIYLIVFIIYQIIRYFKLHIYLLDNMKQQLNSILIINFIFGIISVCVQSYIATLYSDIIPFSTTLLNVGIMLLYFIFSLYSLIRTNTLERTKQNLEQSQQYNKTLSILHDNIRCFKHDFNNIVTTIGGYVQSGDIQGLKTYYTELLGDCQKVNNLSALSPTVINEPAIYSLLTNKYYLADEKGITINLEVFLDLTELNIKPYEFTRILRYFNGQCY